MFDQCLQERHHITGQGIGVNIMTLQQRFEYIADAVRFGEHAPNLARHLIEAKIRTGAHAQDDHATVDVGGGRFLVLNKHAVNRDTQSCQAPPRCGVDALNGVPPRQFNLAQAN